MKSRCSSSYCLISNSQRPSFACHFNSMPTSKIDAIRADKFILNVTLGYKCTHTKCAPSFTHTHTYVHIHTHSLNSNLTLFESLPGTELLTKLPDLSNSDSSVQLGPNSGRAVALPAVRRNQMVLLQHPAMGRNDLYAHFYMVLHMA